MMDYSQNSTNDDPEIGAYKIDSIPHTTATEERALWRKYIKWRHIKRILGSENVLDDIFKVSSIVISRIINEIGGSHDLIILLRRHSGLNELGDTIIEDDEDNVKYMTEVARLIFAHKNKKNEEDSATGLQEENNTEVCYLEDLFGSIFKDMLNNIAFGRGNPNLVEKITKAIDDDPANIRRNYID